MAGTIVALATPMGRSGIGVIRLSGKTSVVLARALTARQEFSVRQAHRAGIIEQVTKEVVDEVIVTYFKGPHSFTGEDVIEIGCHGSPVLLRRVIDLCLNLGARLAEPGEFSLRALSN